jgi:hypothetical protein
MTFSVSCEYKNRSHEQINTGYPRIPEIHVVLPGKGVTEMKNMSTGIDFECHVPKSAVRRNDYDWILTNHMDARDSKTSLIQNCPADTSTRRYAIRLPSDPG